HAERDIESSNASTLKEAWSLPLSAQTTYGASWATPVVAADVASLPDLETNVQAVAIESGKVLRPKNYSEPGQGPNGVVLSGDAVFGATPTKAFALDRESGEEMWAVKLR